jgi:hypothetical protein
MIGDMQMFGLISLLITLLLATLWLSGNFDQGNSVEVKATYQDSIDSANEAADLLERR